MRGHILSGIHVPVVIILTCGCEAFVHTCFNSIHDSLSLRTLFVQKKSANQLDLCLHQRHLRVTSGIQDIKLYQHKDARDIESNNYRMVKYLSRFLQSLFGSLKSNMKRFLWPGLNKFHDPECDALLPEQAPLGCPFFGNNILAGSKKKGSEYFYSEASKKLGHPNIWRFYFMGYPVISVSGSKNVNTILQSKKFNIMGWSGDEKAKKKRKEATLYSSNSVMFEHDREKHQYLRHLLGPAFTPQSVRKGINAIVLAAEEQLSVLKKGQSVKMEDVCENFALDIAWRQIIGLDLKDQYEIARFHKAVNAYVSGVFSVGAYLPDNIPFKTLLPPYRARKYLVHKIKEKIADLETNGPDGSTLSAMVFSTEHVEDVDANVTRLSDEDIIENALILLVAGTETTASTLTSAISFLGLHPDVFEKLRKEQVEIISLHGENITPEILHKSSFLESVIQETLRIVPVSGTNLRKAEETVVLDGKQIPKGSAVFCNIRLTHELDPQVKSETWTDFCPERWLDDNTKPKEDFLPFGSGSRRCIGASLAMAEMRVFLSLFARKAKKFKLDGAGKRREILWRPTSIIPKPDNGVPIILDD